MYEAIFFLFVLYKSMDKNSITFTSNIHFVDRIGYSKLRKKNRIDFWHDVPNILKADEFYSEGIKTCSGGGLVNPSKEAEGFHLWDDKINQKNFTQIVNSLFEFVKEPQRALLIGSKKIEGSPYSVKQFQKFKKIFHERVKYLSFFEQHRYENSQTHYHYSVDNDTWTLFSEYAKSENGRYIQVKDLKKLKECFHNISIAKGDRLFIGENEITVKDAPELFQ